MAPDGYDSCIFDLHHISVVDSSFLSLEINSSIRLKWLLTTFNDKS